MIKRIINNLGEYICYGMTGRTKVPLLTLSSRSSSCRLSWSASQVSAGAHQHCSVRKKCTDKINTKTFKVKGNFWENKHLHQRKFVGMATNAHEIKETLYHGNQVIWLLYFECPELVCYHTTWKNRPYGAVSPSAGWLLQGPYFCDYCMNWVCLSLRLWYAFKLVSIINFSSYQRIDTDHNWHIRRGRKFHPASK